MRLTGVLLVVAVALQLGGCATSDSRGWSGEGAVPFDLAQSTCETEAAAQPVGDARDKAFETCMAGKGWRRP